MKQTKKETNATSPSTPLTYLTLNIVFDLIRLMSLVNMHLIEAHADRADRVLMKFAFEMRNIYFFMAPPPAPAGFRTGGKTLRRKERGKREIGRRAGVFPHSALFFLPFNGGNVRGSHCGNIPPEEKRSFARDSK